MEHDGDGVFAWTGKINMLKTRRPSIGKSPTLLDSGFGVRLGHSYESNVISVDKNIKNLG